jgi:hypothetical protein
MTTNEQLATVGSPVGTIPKPEVIRERLATIMREAHVLRQLLRVAVRAEKELAKREVSGGR